MFDSEVYAFARAGLGEEAEGELVEKLCAAASAELLARLRQGVEPESIKELFVTAAGVLALSMYCALGQNSDGLSFRAGNLSVSRAFRGSGSKAEQLRTQAETMLSAYLADRGFEFRSVEG